MLRIEPVLPMLRTDPALPMLSMLPALPMLRMLHRLQKLRILCELPALSRPARRAGRLRCEPRNALVCFFPKTAPMDDAHLTAVYHRASGAPFLDGLPHRWHDLVHEDLDLPFVVLRRPVDKRIHAVLKGEVR
jgi:hypothetical protein